MQLINQFSALLLFIVPLAGFILIVLTRDRYPAARWPLLALSIGGTALVFYLVSHFQIGAAGIAATQVNTALTENVDGRPVLLELYSDY